VRLSVADGEARSPAHGPGVRSRRRGQASVLLVGLVVVAVAVSIALVAALRLRAQRLEAQRIADGASLAAVRALLDARPPDEIRRGVARYVDRSAPGATVSALFVDPVTDTVIVEVRLPALRLGLPSLLGPRPSSLAATAIARASPGEADLAGSDTVGRPESAEGPPALETAATSGSETVPLLLSSLPDGTDLTVLPRGVPPAYAPALLAAGRERGLPVAVLAAQLAQESGFDPRSLSPAGAAGIAQFMPGTWSGLWNPWRARSPYEAGVAIRAQALYLRGLLLQSRRDVARALAAYNAGSAGAAGPPSTWPLETREYVGRILRMLRAHDVTRAVTAGPVLVDPVPRLTG
jgi:hypothetical protein